MEYMKQIMQGIYKYMTDVIVPVFEMEVPLWVIFMFGLLGSLCVWFIRKFFF